MNLSGNEITWKLGNQITSNNGIIFFDSEIFKLKDCLFD